MDLSNDRIYSHSIDSPRLSTLSNTVLNNSEVKKMQQKLLMYMLKYHRDFYKQNQQYKQKKYLESNFDKVNYGNYENSLTSNFLIQQQSKRNRKQEIRQKLANNYDQMIRLKQQKARQDKQLVRQQQKKNFQLCSWGRDNRQDSLKNKKIQHQYGKQLEMHIRLQEILKYQRKMKERQIIEKFQKEQYQQNLNYDKNQLNSYKKKQQFQKRQNQILGINQSTSMNPESLQSFTSRELQKSDMRAIKRRQQLLYGTGLEQQLRSQTISPKPNERLQYQMEQSNRSSKKQNSEANIFHAEKYNPITNPIQINYKNPYILKMLAQHNV